MVQCREGQHQIDAFVHHLKRRVFLPTVLKIALKTDLCPIRDFLKHYNKHTHMQGIHYHQRPKRDISNSTKLLLDQFSDEQLEQLLEELKNDILQENKVDGNGTLVQLQTQYQNMSAEVHTHQHVYVVLSETGEVVTLPPFTGSLTNTSLSEILEMVNNSMESQTDSESSNDSQDDSSEDGDHDGSNSGGGSSSGSGGSGNSGTSGTSSGGNGAFSCDQISNGQTTNFVNKAYPFFDTSIEDEMCSFLLLIDDSSVCQVRVDLVGMMKKNNGVNENARHFYFCLQTPNYCSL